MDELIIFGGEVKDLGDGKVGGYLVRFGGPDDTDLEGDYFTKDTDFGVDWQDDGTGGKSAVLYAHAMDPVIGKRRLTEAKSVPLKMDDVGIWLEAQLAQRDDYEKAVYGMVKAGKLGWSSGTAPHLVEREVQASGKAWHIKEWPLGLDASLTPRPAESRNCALPVKALKSLLRPLTTSGLKGYLYSDEGRQIAEDMSIAAAMRLHDRLYSGLYDILVYDKRPVAERMADLKGMLAEYGDMTARVVQAIFDGLSPQSPADAAQAVKALIGRGFTGVGGEMSPKDDAPAATDSPNLKQLLLAETLRVDSRSLSLKTAALTTGANS